MTKIIKNDKESTLDFIGRVCSLKYETGLTWEETADILNNELGKDYDERTYRRKYQKWLDSYTTQEMPNISKPSSDESLQENLIEFKKEKIKLRDERSQINALTTLQAREEMMCEVAIECAKKIGETKPLDFTITRKTKNSTKEGILAIGDWHYGIEIDEYWNKFNTKICRNRVKQLAIQTMDIIDKEKLSKIHVLNLGDMISGRIHLPLRINSRIDVVTQTMEVSELIAEFLNFLSEFVTIEYHSVTDNHSRVEPNKKEALQTETFSRIIDWFLEERLRDNKNIRINKNDISDDICTFDVLNHSIAAVHGDKDKTKTLIKNLNTYTQSHFDLILSAHAHHFSADEDNGTMRLCNGSLVGSDDYSSKLRLNSQPSQLFVVSSRNNVTECMYKIVVGDFNGKKKKV